MHLPTVLQYEMFQYWTLYVIFCPFWCLWILKQNENFKKWVTDAICYHKPILGCAISDNFQQASIRPVLWICIGFNAVSDPDTAFYLSADPEPDLDPGRQIIADPCESGYWSWSDFAVTKSWIFTWKIYFMDVIGHKNIPTKVQKHFWMVGKQVYFL